MNQKQKCDPLAFYENFCITLASISMTFEKKLTLLLVNREFAAKISSGNLSFLISLTKWKLCESMFYSQPFLKMNYAQKIFHFCIALYEKYIFVSNHI